MHGRGGEGEAAGMTAPGSLPSVECQFPGSMGVPLFDFAANIGKKVFNRGEDKAAEKLKKHIEANNPGVSGLAVRSGGQGG